MVTPKSWLKFVVPAVVLVGVSGAAGPEATREATCVKVAKPPVLDGKLDDPCWAEARVIDKFPSFWSGAPSSGSTKARLVWDDEGLYYAGVMTDKELRSFGKKRNDSLWDGDVFELFFKPSAASPAYYEFQANPKGLIFEMAMARRGDEKAKDDLGMKVAVAIEGTLDTPGDTDRGWAVEGMIPWSAFRFTGGRPKVGDVWSFALCRYDYGVQGTQPVLTSSAPLEKPNYHKTEDYGRLTFKAGK